MAASSDSTLRGQRRPQRRVQDHPQRRCARDHPHGELRVVLQQGARPDEDRVAAGAHRVRDLPLRLAADPLRVAGPRGDPPVERLGVLQDDVGPVGPGVQRRRAGVADVDRRGGQLRQPGAGRLEVSEPRLLGLQVAAVVPVRRGAQRLQRLDRDPVPPEAGRLARVVRQQPHRPDAEGFQHRGRVAVVAQVGMQTEAQVGVDGVGSRVLLDVGPQLVDQPDPAALVAVDDRGRPPGPRRPRSAGRTAAGRRSRTAASRGRPRSGTRSAPGSAGTRRPPISPNTSARCTCPDGLSNARARNSPYGVGIRADAASTGEPPVLRPRRSVHAPDSSLPRRRVRARYRRPRSTPACDQTWVVNRRGGPPTALRRAAAGGAGAGGPARPRPGPAAGAHPLLGHQHRHGAARLPGPAGPGAADRRADRLAGRHLPLPVPLRLQLRGRGRALGRIGARRVRSSSRSIRTRTGSSWARTTSSRCPRPPTRARPRCSPTSRPGCSSPSTPDRWRTRPSPCSVSAWSA